MLIERNEAFQRPLSEKSLGFLFSWVFDVHINRRPITIPSKYVQFVAQVVDAALQTLTPQEEEVVRMYVGVNASERGHTKESIAKHFGVTRHKIRAIEDEARRKLKHPSTSLKAFLDSPEEELQRFLAQRSSPQRLTELVPVIEKIKRLEPSLIAHLQQHNDDLLKINPLLFEHLFGEFLASRGFEDVRLVGRNARTSADIFAAKFVSGPDIAMRFFVEVKRWKATIGIEVINQVLGAYLGERDRFGWNAALIVTVGGFKEFEKWSREELELKGLFLQDRDDLLRYLDGYQQHANGLWLPNPRTDL